MRTSAIISGAVSMLALALAAPAAAAGLSPVVAARGPLITLAEFTLLLFTIANSARVVAYLPQIWKAAATVDPQGARGISCLSWSLFLVSNLATAAYAVVNLQDWTMAAIFLASTACCAAIIALAAWRRYRRRR